MSIDLDSIQVQKDDDHTNQIKLDDDLMMEAYNVTKSSFCLPSLSLPFSVTR